MKTDGWQQKSRSSHFERAAFLLIKNGIGNCIGVFSLQWLGYMGVDIGGYGDI
ncbi:hypothetical protein [Propionispira arboris]|uniref:hypothetical protein n=1 Tax=Propionispira arboris TaxID=84035 RepID=UPI0015A6F829|nr:hypothetical protein [Propionispira arboris]